MASSSSSSVAAAASFGNERNRVADRNPPLIPGGHGVYIDQLYLERRRHHELPLLCRTVAWGVLAFLAITCFVILVWLIFHPIFPNLRVASATISTVSVNTTSATAECSVVFLLTNLNRHLTTIYERMEIALFYPSQRVLLSHDYQPPFVQPARSRLTFGSNLSFSGVDLGTDVVNAMKQDVDRGSLSLGIKVLATVRYKNWKWRTRSQYMRAYCLGAFI